MDKSADEMVNILLKDPARLEVIKSNPAKELPKVAKEAKEQTGLPNNPVYWMIVGALGLVAILALVGAVVLVAIGKTAPDTVVALGSASIGALAGVLIPQKQ